MRNPNAVLDPSEDAAMTEENAAILEQQKRQNFFEQNPVMRDLRSKQSAGFEQSVPAELRPSSPLYQPQQTPLQPTREEIAAEVIEQRAPIQEPMFDKMVVPRQQEAQAQQAVSLAGNATVMRGFEALKKGEAMATAAEAARLEAEAEAANDYATEVEREQQKIKQEQELLLNKKREVSQKAIDFNEQLRTRQIDTDRFWSSRTTGQKALMLTGVFLMGVGGRDGLAQINNLIERDIDAQKEDWARGEKGVKNMVSIMNDLYGDEQAALDMSKAMAYENLKNKLTAKLASTKSQDIRAKIPKAIALIEIEQGKYMNDAALKLAQAQKAGKKDKELDISGEDAKRITFYRDGLEAIKRMKRALKQGQNTFSLIGDNDYTAARDYFIESFRSGTGAAMPDYERKTYSGMAPKWTDTPQIQKMKIDIAEKRFLRDLDLMERKAGTEKGFFTGMQAPIKFQEPK
jgi:hypothetical protein